MKMQKLWYFAGLAMLAALPLAGCSGEDGKNGLNGKDGVDAGTVTTVASLTPEQWSSTDFAPKGEVQGVTINSPPVVKFKLTDASGKPLTGFSNYTSRSASATVASYSNISFSLAKLVPGTNGSPSKWVNYIVTTVPTKTAAATATRPTTDNTGTLKENSDGTYEYTFYRDITKIKDQVAAMTLTAPNNAADLGDLTYDKNLVHRLTIQVSGAARGTGSNTADGVTVTPAVNMVNPLNIIYDFVPATGKAVAAKDSGREIASLAGCNDCHTKLNGLGFHGGTRYEAKYCVVCHTDQRKFGYAEAATTATGYDVAAGQRKVNGFALGDFPNLVHKIHMGNELSRDGYNYANVKFNEVTYPQPVTNCAKCHTKTDAAPQGDNWQSNASRVACGACHDGITWADNSGATKHIGGSAADDTQCALCHKAADVKAYHVTVDKTTSTTTDYASQLTLPAGAAKFAYEIKSVTVAGAAGAKKATVQFRVLKDGAPVTFKTYAAGATALLDNFTGGPSIYVSWSRPQDGIVAPSDFNVASATTGAPSSSASSASLVNIWNGTGGNTLTGPDASGVYTALVNSITVPDDAVMVTATLGYGAFAQTNVPGYSKTNGLSLPATAVHKVATGYTARRSIVDNAKCNACHGQLGISPTFHSGVRNNGESCAILCHNTTRNSGGWSSITKEFVHSIHAASNRSNPYNWHSDQLYKDVKYPAILKNCEQCHLPGTYDFSASAYTQTVLDSMLYTTAVASNITAASNLTNYPVWAQTLAVNNYGASLSENLVTSPITSACIGCHDSSMARAHMSQNGGSIYVKRSVALTVKETCLTCHASGKVGDIKKAHKY